MIPSTARKVVNGAEDVEMDEEESKKNFGSVPMLTMLAEVASATLESDPVLLKDSAHKARKSALQADALVLDQIRILSDRMLLDMFSELTSNEMRRTFSYRCYLMPNVCAETFSSFGSENKARLQMKSHLMAHIAKLLAEANAPGRQGKPPFTAEPLQARKRRLQETEGNNRKRRRPQAKQPSGVNKNERRSNGSATVPAPGTGATVKKSQARVKSQAKPPLAKPEGKNNRPTLKVAVKSLTTPSNKTKAPSTTGKAHNATVKEEKPLRPITETWEAHVVRRDHSYWGPGCPLSVDNSDDSDLEELCGDCVERRPVIPNQSVIATPAFPYVYVPLLPNTSSVVEVTTPGGGIGGGAAKRRVPSPMLPSSDDEEDDEDEDDDEEEEEQQSKQQQLPVAKGRARLPGRRGAVVQAAETSLERKAALKHIKALRNKRRDERGPLVCKICKTKVFTAQATLMYHYRSHAGIKPFNCKICDATFTRQHSLNYHMLIHNNKSRFACEDCGRHFRHPSHFKEHLRRHTGETPYQCTDCNQRFKTRNTYKRHLKTRHGKILTAQGILSVGESRPTSPAPT